MQTGNYAKNQNRVLGKEFGQNVENDAKHKQQLEEIGFKVIIIWECEIEKKFDATMEKLVSELKGVNEENEE